MCSACTVTGARQSEHITPALARFHWLKIAERVKYKVALLILNAFTLYKPDYSSHQLHPAIHLHSSEKNWLLLKNRKTAFAKKIKL